MTEIKLVLLALTVTCLIQFFETSTAILWHKTTNRNQLSSAFLNLIGIENYTICEKALCQMVQFTIGLAFISTYEMFGFELDSENRFLIALTCGIIGIFSVKSLFSMLIKPLSEEFKKSSDALTVN
ncbi:hypothetical protein [Flavobacterium noncentrifugens]|uniref:Uncharacterized protein n=1 Tax=Flavobacterium noncentrifugens TaxID=1128970 RepID=A0A1G8YJD0_9FLAO|nr:hypothetical protein [Flavobacterium noncentrifugens]SDK02989.1 hypothetical protein SAMN04487935_2361 [Flavobacterium noncentrifugens]